MRYIMILFTILSWVQAQVYLHPTTGVAGTYSGGCQIHDCSGTYRDDGNTGNYSNNVNWVYQTFCPDQPGMCVRLTFTSFNVESGFWGSMFGCGASVPGPTVSCWDVLLIANGPAQNSPWVWYGCGNSLPPTITSTDPSGCLTTRFCSDGTGTLAGWNATISCVPCAANNGVNGDCTNPVTVCSDGPINDYSSGPGLSGECGGCITNETYTNWYVFQPQGSSGTITLSVCPQNGTDDFDFAIFGPFNGSIDCNNLASKILRCTYAVYPRSGGCGQVSACSQLGGDTDVSEDVCGNGMLAPLPVTAGQLYLLMINGWTPNSGSNGYNITWGLPAGMTLNCNPLSLAITAFNATKLPDRIKLTVSIHSDEPIQSLIIEKLSPDSQWTTLVESDVTDLNTQLSFDDTKPYYGINSYRVRYLNQEGISVTYPRVQTITWYPPNPLTIFTDEQLIKVQLEHPAYEKGEIHVYTMDGKLFTSIPVQPYLGEFAISRESFPNGIYLFEYEGLVTKVVLK